MALESRGSEVAGEEDLPPNYAKLDTALRSIGYSFESAVADIIDNSVDASASCVLVRLITRQDGKLDLLILDDGKGMTRAELREAMRFGSDVGHQIQRLGKFGLGLKLASLSQARALRVVTRKSGLISGRGWLETGISSGFKSTVLSQEACRAMLALAEPAATGSATVVHWADLYRAWRPYLPTEAQASKLLVRLKQHLSMAFHRFLAGDVARKGGQLRISLDIYDEGERAAGIPVLVNPLNPFGYANTGVPGYPADLSTHVRDAGILRLQAHIWPSNSSSAEYKLPGGSNARQGFYLYRNQRLIQAGGWHGLREAEPHLSLARVEVDLDEGVDLDVSLDVKKTDVQMPHHLVQLISEASTVDGVDFRQYVSAAQQAYRKRMLEVAELPLVPTEGLPAPLAKFLREEFRLEGTRKFRGLGIGWADLSEDEFFRIERADGRLLLNRAFRKVLLHGLPGSSADAPVVKCLLFLALEDALSSERTGARMRERLDQINRILLKAVQYERVAV